MPDLQRPTWYRGIRIGRGTYWLLTYGSFLLAGILATIAFILLPPFAADIITLILAVIYFISHWFLMVFRSNDVDPNVRASLASKGLLGLSVNWMMAFAPSRKDSDVSGNGPGGITRSMFFMNLGAVFLFAGAAIVIAVIGSRFISASRPKYMPLLGQSIMETGVSVVVYFGQCTPEQASFSGPSGSTNVSILGASQDGTCRLEYEIGLRGAAQGQQQSSFACGVPMSMGRVEFLRSQTGINIDPIQQYCK